MARPSEYARWRKVMMQTVLCAALGISIAVAWWIGHVHAAVLNTSLGAPKMFANRVLNVDLRLPPDWKAESYSRDEALSGLVVTEEKSNYGAPRIVNVFFERLHAASPIPTPSEIFADSMGNRPFDRELAITYLGQPAVLREYPWEPGVAGVSKPSAAILYACTVIPGPRPVAVAVRMRGPLSFAPADIELLKSIAQSLQLPDPAHPAAKLSAPNAGARPRMIDAIPASDNNDEIDD